MTVQVQTTNDSSLQNTLHPDARPGTNDINPRMRSGIIWTGGGLLTLAGTILFAAESLISPGGWSLPVWLWPLPFVLGVAAIGIGFGVMVDESVRQQQADAEAHDAFAEIHLDDDANIAESHDNWE